MLSRFTVNGVEHAFFDVRARIGEDRFRRLPYAMRVVCENVLRNLGRPGADDHALDALTDPSVPPESVAVPLHVPRIVLPDSTGVPALIDLAALRSAVARADGDPLSVNAGVPVDLIVDHSMQVDRSASPDAEQHNRALEFERNAERYAFLRWAQTAFSGLAVHPPGTGIIHQVHLEQIARVVMLEERAGQRIAFPDTALGGDSHTTMVNALGVLGWGIGGIEAETILLGEPYILPKPECVGVRLVNAIPAGITITDVALTLTHRLRAEGVVGRFVEFFGPAVDGLGVPDRSTLSNMAPEYGATTGFWPVDGHTLAYLALTGRSSETLALVEAHARAAGLFREPDMPDPDYDRIVEFDLAAVGPSVAGPGKPYLRRGLEGVAPSFAERLGSAPAPNGSPRPDDDMPADGALAIAAITSCTNTANPRGMITAGLVAREAAGRGLLPRSWVKTSFTPGSRAVTGYLEDAGLLAPMRALGFDVAGYGCATCGGKSGPIKPEMEALAGEGRMLAAVLSGNRNFDGRIHRLVGASYLCSPALVIAYAIAGRIDIDVKADTLAYDRNGEPVGLRELWPDEDEIDAVLARVVNTAVYDRAARSAAPRYAEWDALPHPVGVSYPWDRDSQYIVEPPFFSRRGAGFARAETIRGARALGFFEDGIPTDHISPGGEIPQDSPAGLYLQSLGVPPSGFNTYVGRRGNHEVMARSTFANLRIRNRMINRSGWWTRLLPEDEIVTFHDAAMSYQARGVPLVVLAGENFGVGSSRDWAAKGQALLGIGAVLAGSFERIHRSNLVGVGIVPLLFAEGQDADGLGLTGLESFDLADLARSVAGDGPVTVTAHRPSGKTVRFEMTPDLRSDAERDLVRRGGIFAAALERASRQPAGHDAR